MLRNLYYYFNRIAEKAQNLIAPKPIGPPPPLDNKNPSHEVPPSVPTEEVPIVPSNPPKIRPPKKVRYTTAYKKNVTAALELPVTKEHLTQLKKDPDALFNICKDNLKEHASLRVDIYFYLLIAIYNTQLPLKQGDTILQHGRGRKTSERQTVTHACHSNLFPTLIHPASDAKESIFANTHFMDTMNATVELPAFVNQLDMILEGKIKYPSELRKRGLEILQNVANGKYDPIEGFQLFLKKTHQVLESLEYENVKSKNKSYLSRTSGVSKQIKLQLLNIVKNGTFFCEKKEDLNTYFQLLLRLNPSEIAECRKNPEWQKKIYSEKMEIIKKEILETKSRVPHKIQSRVM